MINMPPAVIFILGACLIPFFKGKIKQGFLLLLPLLAFAHLLTISEGIHFTYRFLGHELIFGRVDKLSLFFGLALVIMALIAIIYSIHVEENGHHIAALTYVGSALGVVFAGDFLALFIFWEIMAFSSVFLIWSRRRKASIDAGFRYIMVHVLGGLLLFCGIVLHLIDTGSLAFGLLENTGLAYYLILIGFLLNAAVPPLHAWLPDAYPEASITGAIFLSAFTTKTAVYVLIRAFPGAEMLVCLGAVMAIYGIVYAVLENDIRRLLSYHIISQLGYMVVGIGIGSIMGLNGAAAHAFSNILYKGLLFMVAGAVIQMTGKSKLTELGGLYKTMPMTFILCLVAGLSISAFPFFNGFVSKSLVLAAAADEHLTSIWLMLTFASAGTFLSIGLKFIYFIFLGHDAGLKAKDPPMNMLMAMGLAGFLCILIGVFPSVLYNVLPYSPMEYHPYTASHVVWTLQILAFTGLVFFLLFKRVKPKQVITLDTDWFYRKGAVVCLRFLHLLVKSKAMTSLDLERFFEKGIKAFMKLIITPWYQMGIMYEKVFTYSTPHLSKNADLSFRPIETDREGLFVEAKTDEFQPKKRWIPVPAKVAAVWITVYLSLKFLINPPLPSSLIVMYMTTITAGLVLSVSIYGHTLEGFTSPILWFLRGDTVRAWPWQAARWAFLVTMPLYVGYGVYQRVVPRFEPPIVSRVIHPAPPFEFSSLENPLREDEENMEANIEAGRVVFFKNCFFCHGDKLNGKGHFATGYNLRPANFQDVGTIAQLQEAFVFWRISTGGIGLPEEATPWDSAMPRWKDMLTEKERWQVIMFLYNYTGHSPRTWED